MATEQKKSSSLKNAVAVNASNGPANPLIAALLGILGGAGVDPKAWNPSVERTGDRIILPEGASIPDVMRSLQLKHEEEERLTKVSVTIDCPPWDGAKALHKAIDQELGMVIQKAVGNGWEPPTAARMEVESGLGETVLVPWGKFELPGMDGAIAECNITMKEGLVVFKVDVTAKSRFERRVRKLLATCAEIAAAESIHRGKAFAMSFFNDNGSAREMPVPRFFKMSNNDPIFSRQMERAIERNIFTPIRYANDLPEMGMSLKRGVLFAGKFGVGKTMLAGMIARFANEHGWTFLYVKEPSELPQALRYAQQYQPVVVFAEDVDRIAGPERTDEVNKLLNQLDGIDTKATKIITVLTTNRPDILNPAMRRPGRIDLILEVEPPNAETVSRMIRSFAGDSLDPNQSIDSVSELMAGNTPARVREVVDRARMESLRRTASPNGTINDSDLTEVAAEIIAESKLFSRQDNSDSIDHAAVFGRSLRAAGEVMTDLAQKERKTG